MTLQITNRMKVEHIEEAKEMFGQILQEVESGERRITTITIRMTETGISILEVEHV